jgi:hypothetical protein
MQQAFQIAPGPIYQREQPERNPAYRKFLRSFPRIVCGKSRWIEAAHFGPHSLGQRASDTDCLPLCWTDHRGGNRSYHKLGPVRFARVHQIDPPELIAFFNHLWELRIKK